MSWNGLYGILSNDQEHAEYDDVYDEAGDAVYCDHCGAEIYAVKQWIEQYSSGTSVRLRPVLNV